MELYEIRGLGFTYPNGAEPALNGIDLTIRQGEFVVLCGASGCGKTTLLRLLKPTLAPAGAKSGEILFCGRDAWEIEERRLVAEVGFVMQNPENQSVCEYVWQELAFTLESLGFSGGEIRTRVAEMVSFFGIEDWFYQKVSKLSGGQKQLLNLASVMATGPKVLILDEPTAQLDPIAAREFLETLSRLCGELGTTVILSEHRLEDAIPLASRVLILEEGRLIADCPPRELEHYLKDNPMVQALPTPMRIHRALDPETLSPLTVGEGRRWLEEFSRRNAPTNPPVSKPEPSFGEVLLEAKDLWFRYEKNGKDILKGLSLTLHKGEIYTLFGGNGAGKTTALKVLAGQEKAFRGKVCVEDNVAVAVLPQDPQTLFVGKSVEEELLEMVPSLTVEDRERMEQVADLCDIRHLYQRHPYDLSGGEQQRVALAKILLTGADILLMDEPTKGMDVWFKEEFAGILKELICRGATILIVSHDVEFGAKYAHRCGLIFDGALAGEDIPKRFFGGKTFYTTAAGRMARNVFPEAIIAEDVISACGGEILEGKRAEKRLPVIRKEEAEPPKPQPTKGKGLRMMAGLLLGILFFLTTGYIKNQPPEKNTIFLQILSIVEAWGCLWAFFGRKEVPQPKVAPKKGVSPPMWIGFLSICILVPLTGYLGMTLFDGRKYYLTSVLILMETLLPFLLLWGRRKSAPRELVIIAVLSALSVGGRMAFSMIPQFKPVLAMVIIAGICFGGETGFLVGAVTAFVSNFFLGQGSWTPWQMLATGMVGFVAGVLTERGILSKRRATICIYGFLSTLILYGGILNPISVILYQESVNMEMILASFLMGVPFDLIHAASTAFFLWMLQKPMEEKLFRIKTKYGLEEK